MTISVLPLGFCLCAGLLTSMRQSGAVPPAITETRPQVTAIKGVAVKGADELLLPGLVLLLGEIHGTSEVPMQFGDLVAYALAQGVPVRVGLELPATEQVTIDAAFAAEDEADAEECLATSGFFRRASQDGRSSVAMASLILRLRSRAKAGSDLRVICFDETGHPERDRIMAQRIAAIHAAEPAAACLVLTGNAHARREKSRFPFTPMGAHLITAKVEFVSLRAVSSGGSAWVCQPGNNCGALQIGGSDMGPEPFLAMGTSDVPAGYDGIWYVGRVQASEPFIDALGGSDH